MITLLETIKSNEIALPKYTKYELAKIVREKRLKNDLSISEVALKYGVSNEFWSSIENASRSFNVKIYKIICDFTELSKEEVLSNEKSIVSYRAISNETEDVVLAVKDAEAIFNEIVLQLKINC